MSVIGSVAPGLLIAPPALSDPNFDRTVVAMAVHNDDGALGFVVNRLAPVTLGELLAYAGFGDEMKRLKTPVYLGGPVQPSSAWILRGSPPLAEDGTLSIGSRIRVSSSREALQALVLDLETEQGASEAMVLLGYSGWAPGQLEGELAAGAWVPVPLDEEILFDPELDRKWERAYARCGMSPIGGMMMRGGSA